MRALHLDVPAPSAPPSLCAQPWCVPWTVLTRSVHLHEHFIFMPVYPTVTSEPISTCALHGCALCNHTRLPLAPSTSAHLFPFHKRPRSCPISACISHRAPQPRPLLLMHHTYPHASYPCVPVTPITHSPEWSSICVDLLNCTYAQNACYIDIV